MTTTIGRTFLIAAWLLAAAAAAAGPAAAADDPPAYTLDTDPIRLANRALEQGRLDDAREHFAAAVAAGYKTGEAQAGLGTIAARQGRHDDAARHFAAAVEAGGRTVASAHAGLGLLALRDGRRDEAAGQFAAALALDDETWPARYGRARLLLDEGRWDEARAELEAGRNRRGALAGEALYHHGRALLLLGTGDLAGAEKAALQAVAVDPADPDNARLLGRIYAARGVPALAIAAYEDALAAPGVEPSAAMLHQLGNLYREQQRYNEARDRYQRAVAVDSTYAPVLEDLADLLRLAGRPQAAAGIYLRYVESAPGDTSAWVHLAESLGELGRFAEARDAAQRALALDPAAAAARRVAVRAGLRSGDAAARDEAAAAMAAALDDSAAWSAADLLDLATWQTERQDWAAAQATLARAAAADSTQYQVPHQQGVVALRAGDPAAAVAHFTRALRLAPDAAAASVRLNLGLALYQAGRTQEALAALREAVVQDPDLAAARLILAQVLTAAGDDRAAEAEYRALLERQPGHAAALRGVGFSRLRAADYRAARAAYAQAADAEPGNADGWAGLGSAELGLGNLEAADAALARARELDPRNVMARRSTELLNEARSARKESEQR